MEQNALDDAHFLCFLAHIDQTLVRSVAVIGHNDLLSLGHVVEIICSLVWHIAIDGDGTDGNVNDTNPGFSRQGSNHGAPKEVGYTQTRFWSHNRRCGCVPFAQCTFGLVEIPCSQHLEARINIHIHILWNGVAFHIRLPKAEVNVEIRIYFSP